MRRPPSPAGRLADRPKVSPQAAASLLEAAVKRHQAGELDEAWGLYQRLLSFRPNDPDALHLAGVVAYQRGDAAAAKPLIRRAIQLAPGQAAFHNALGVVMLSEKRSDEAISCFERAIRLNPEYAEAHNNLGNARQAKGLYAAALEAYEHAIALRPAYAEAHSNRAVALRALGRLAEAEAVLHLALHHNPRHASALANLALVLQDQARYNEALAAAEAAVMIAPNHAEARCNRAVLLLQQGRFAEGWADYEWRWRASGFTTPPRDFSEAAWDGSPLAGRTILIHAEQGLGSAIQFARFLPDVAARGGRIILECQPPLLRLFSLAFVGPGRPVAAVIPKGRPLPERDVQLPMMSLPGRLGTTLATIPARVPYLFAEAAAIETWRARFAPLPRPRVGLVWAGNPQHRNDRNRSMPAVALKPLVTAGVGGFVSLQVGAAAAQLAMLPPRHVADFTAALGDFLDTAAAVAALDLVISVDTAVAHLAGAMAKPVWLLVPFVAEWRWLLDREDSPWYPTMRIFRQTSRDDWAGVVAQVNTALRSFRPTD